MFKKKSIIPGFGLTLGFTLTYLGLIVLIPLATVFLKTSSLELDQISRIILSPRSLAALKVSFCTSLAAASINTVFGLIVAWVLVRYAFPGRALVDAVVDLPFALPTAVAGVALTSIYSPTGWLGRWFYAAGIETAYSQSGIVIALTFIGLPFVVRTVQPVLREIDPEVEEAAASLGARRWQTFLRVLMPGIVPALLTGFALAFARALGEYGSVVFISGNKPMETEVVPLLIMTKLEEEYRYETAAALAAFMLVLSFALLLCINLLQWYSRRRHQPA